MELLAAIFDLDGTIIENEKVYGKAFRKVLKNLGVDTKEELPQISGIGVTENWPKLIRKYNIDTDKSPEELGQETQNEYAKLIKEVRLKEGFPDFIKDLRESGMSTALATSNTWESAQRIFDSLDVQGYFDSITTGEEVDRKKPSPEIFVKAADKLNVEPEKCVVFEDSPAGIEAAKAAGMKVVGIARDDEHREELEEADLVIEDYTEFNKEFTNSI